MKKNNNKKGFTLTELLIVIVIIGILAGVLIPTFASFINRAHKSAAEQEAMAVYQDWIIKDKDDEMVDLLTAEVVVLSKDEKYFVRFEQGAMKANAIANTTNTDVVEEGFSTDYSYTDWKGLGSGKSKVILIKYDSGSSKWKGYIDSPSA